MQFWKQLSEHESENTSSGIEEVEQQETFLQYAKTTARAEVKHYLQYCSSLTKGNLKELVTQYPSAYYSNKISCFLFFSTS